MHLDVSSTHQNVKADQEDEDASGNTESRQSNAKHPKDEIAGDTEQRNDHEGNRDRLQRHHSSGSRVVTVRQSEKDRRVRNRIHDGQEAHEHGRRM